jgi:hypothetical protein
MISTISETTCSRGGTIERLLYGCDRAIWSCAATGWSTSARKALRIELLTLRANLARYASAARSDARRLDPDFAADETSSRSVQLEIERLFVVPRILAARLAACGDDREELYHIRDEFQKFEKELEELDATTELFPLDPRGEVDEDPAPGSKRTWRFFGKWMKFHAD